MILTRSERFEEFRKRMSEAQLCSNALSALALITHVLTEVEDEFSGIANNSTKYRNDGRLYPPQADAMREVPDRPDRGVTEAWRTTHSSAWTGPYLSKEPTEHVFSTNQRNQARRSS